jgi:hypothetical protein
MMEKATFWSRVGHWFRPSGRSVTVDDIGQDGPMGDGGGAHLSDSPVSDVLPPSGGSRFRLARTSPAVERLEEEYSRIVRLVESVQTHLERQGERSEVMARSLSSVADSLTSLPEASRSNSEALSAINVRLETDGATLKRLDDNLSPLPRLADAQRETMVTIGRHLEVARESNEKLVTTLDGFQQAVTLVSEATSATARALQQIRVDAGAKEDRVAAALREQTRRMTMFAAAAVGLATVAAVLAVVALFRS